MPFSTIAVTVEGPRASITLQRPEKLNPLSPQTLRELAEAAHELDAREGVKVVVVSGSGRAFSSGADVSVFAGAESPSALDVRESADAGRRMAEAVAGMRALTIAAIHGHCVGGAVVLAAACDLRVAAEGTRFSIPEVDLGIPLAWGGIPRLVREIGPAMTKELVLTCRPFDAREAHALGLVNRVVADSELDRAVEDLAAQLALKSSLTLRATKEAVAAASENLLPTGAAWSDADVLLTALADSESRRAAEEYLAGLRRR
jgi:enoyl-CoA hydratase/carnithine racemase